jgi:hypothetical protein
MTTKQEEEWTVSSSGKNKQVHLLPKDYSLNNLSVQHLRQSDDAPENILHVFIPRILTNVSKDCIVHAFEQQKIGKVFYIDAKFKVNQNQNAYGFAFVSVSLYDNEEVRAMRDELAKTGVARITYDAPLYWEVKQYVPREKRALPTVVVVPNLVVPKPEIVDITTIESALLLQNTRSEALGRDVIADRKTTSSPVNATASPTLLYNENPSLRATAPEFKYNVVNLYAPFSEPRCLPDWSYNKDIQYIQKLCTELSTQNTSFTSEDYAEMEDDYSLFSSEIFNYNVAA